jgi:hypothetical protein
LHRPVLEGLQIEVANLLCLVAQWQVSPS